MKEPPYITAIRSKGSATDFAIERGILRQWRAEWSRERNGPFTTVDDLNRVPGIGDGRLAPLRELVTV